MTSRVLAPSLRAVAGGPGTEPAVVWRVWRIGRNHGAPMLTGVFGFPWPDRQMDARCVLPDPSHAALERHHRVVPHPGCSCGIYALADPLGVPRIRPGLRREPLAAGFVELSGRVLRAGDRYRAQRARIVGPVTIFTGSPALSRRLARRLRPGAGLRVLPDGPRYLVAWGRRGTPWPEWRRRTAQDLAGRYGVRFESG